METRHFKINSSFMKASSQLKYRKYESIPIFTIFTKISSLGNQLLIMKCTRLLFGIHFCTHDFLGFVIHLFYSTVLTLGFWRFKIANNNNDSLHIDNLFVSRNLQFIFILTWAVNRSFYPVHVAWEWYECLFFV